MPVDLSAYDNSWYKPGRSALVRVAWYFCNALLMQTYLVPVSGFKVFLLRIFGAKIGRGVNIKPAVNVKYPWLLEVGDHSWIGEKVWIDNLAPVRIGAHVCLSQGCMLLTGNHDYKKKQFDLLVQGIVLEDGVWIGAKSLVAPGVTCGTHAVLAAQSVAAKDLESYKIYAGNPAAFVRERLMEEGI